MPSKQVGVSVYCASCGRGLVSNIHLKHDDRTYIQVCSRCADYPFISMVDITAGGWDFYNSVVKALERSGFTDSEATTQLSHGILVKNLGFVKFKKPNGDIPLPNRCPRCGQPGSPHFTWVKGWNRDHRYSVLRYAHYRDGYRIKWCYVRSLGRVAASGPSVIPASGSR